MPRPRRMVRRADDVRTNSSPAGKIDRPLTEPPISDLYFGVREGPHPPVNRLKTLTALVYLPSGQGLDRRGSGPPPSDDSKRRIKKVDRNRAGSRFDADSQPTATRFVAGANHAAHPVRSATARGQWRGLFRRG